MIINSLSKDQVCKVLGIGKSKIDQLMDSGELPYYRDGKKLKFLESDVEKYRAKLIEKTKTENRSDFKIRKDSSG
jgi:excisionase family DNA binding protein